MTERTEARRLATLAEDFSRKIGEAMGWPPMAGRLAAVLMFSEEPLTVEELQEELGASKGSVSEMTRLLIDNGTVRRFKRQGQRHFVYEWRADAWVGCLMHQLRQIRSLREMADAAREGVEGMSPSRVDRVEDMREYYEFMERSMDSLVADYTRQRQRPQDASRD